MHNQHIAWIVQDVQASAGPRNSSSILQNRIGTTLKEIKDVVIFQDDVLVYGTTNDQYEKRMLAVKSRLREKKVYQQ